VAEAPDGYRERLRTLVVDDEKLARVGLGAMLAADPELIVEECASGPEAIRLLRDMPIDLVFLDVQMPKVSGFDVIAAVGSDHMPVVVFTTAYSEYAIQAFEACALDYLLKPIREPRLAQAVARAKKAVGLRRLGPVSQRVISLMARQPALQPTAAASACGTGPHADEPSSLRRVLLRSGARSYYLDVEDIDWIESDAYYARLWTGVRFHLVRQSLRQLEVRLDRRLFVRVHRTAIVNVTQVREIRSLGLARYAVVLHDGRQVALSRERRRMLHVALAARR
jgi:two-component system LytT family response regulator